MGRGLRSGLGSIGNHGLQGLVLAQKPGGLPGRPPFQARQQHIVHPFPAAKAVGESKLRLGGGIAVCKRRGLQGKAYRYVLFPLPCAL